VPTLGQHNAEILGELGYGKEEIEVLAAEKVIGARPEGVAEREAAKSKSGPPS
jgi:hypothetical protein